MPLDVPEGRGYRVSQRLGDVLGEREPPLSA